jgi:DNA-binding transcriptional LysR family regulator
MSSRSRVEQVMQNVQTVRVDLLAACQAFVSVADRGSFTHGATWVGVSQSVVSRRIAGLERRLGGTVLDRSGRTPSLTPLGRHLLPTARRMVEAAEELILCAEESRLSAVPLAVPEGCDVRDLAAVQLAGRDADSRLELVPARPHARPEMLSRLQVLAAVLPCPPEEAVWRVQLGAAGAVPRTGRMHLDQLKPGRQSSAAQAPRLWLLPEDDVPHVRDPLVVAAESFGLAPFQVAVAASAASALAAVLASSDVVLLSRSEAVRLDLSWAPLASPVLQRGYNLKASVPSEARRILKAVGAELAHALGVDDRSERA